MLGLMAALMVIWACVKAAVTLGLMTALMTARQPFGEAVAGIVSGVHLAVIGTLPRIDASLVAVIGTTAVCQPLQLLRRPHLQLLAPMALAPVVLAPLTHAIAFGVLLTAIAIAWSYWLLTRSSTPFRAGLVNAWTEQ